MKLPTLPRSLLLYRCVFVVLLSFITWLALTDPTDMLIFSLLDKLLHTAAFAVLSFLLDRSFHDSNKYRWLLFAQAGVLLVYGIVIEWLQSHIPYREASWLDLIANSAGIIGYWIIRPQIEAGQAFLQDR